MNGHTLKNTSVVIDSDRTLTKWSYPNPNGWKRIDLTSYAFLRWRNDIDPQFFVEWEKLYNYYCLEVERGNYPEDFKLEKMYEWVSKVNDLYYRYLNSETFDDALRVFAPKLEIREWMADFLNFLWNYDVPTLIYSAGVKNVIRSVLDYNGFSSSNIHIHWNEINFDSHGKFIIPESSQFLLPGNKNWDRVPENISHHFRNRTHMIIKWDSPDDILMWDAQKQIHSIGFLLESNNDPDSFKKIFTEVIESEECDKGRMAEISKYLLNQK